MFVLEAFTCHLFLFFQFEQLGVGQECSDESEDISDTEGSLELINVDFYKDSSLLTFII